MLVTASLAAVSSPASAATKDATPRQSVIFAQLELKNLPESLTPLDLSRDESAGNTTLSFAGEDKGTSATVPFLTVTVRDAGVGIPASALDQFGTEPQSVATKVQGKRGVERAIAPPWKALSFTVDERLVTVAGRDLPTATIRNVSEGVRSAPAGAASTALPLAFSPPSGGDVVTEPSPAPASAQAPADDLATAQASVSWSDTHQWQHNFTNVCDGAVNTRNTVRAIQSNMWAHGYNIALDGLWGPNTKSTLRTWQQTQSMTADGCAGYNVKHRMYHGSYLFTNATTSYRVPFLRFTGDSNYNYQSRQGGLIVGYRVGLNHDANGYPRTYVWLVNNYGTFYCIPPALGVGC